MPSKRLLAVKEKFSFTDALSLEKALSEINSYSSAVFKTKAGSELSMKLQFDETVSLEFELGVDGKRSDQMIKASVALPFSHGKNRRILAITQDVSSALNNGATEAIDKSGLAKIASKDIDLKKFDLCITSEEMMKDIASSGCSRILGVSGLMPSVRSGTVFKNDNELLSNLAIIVNKAIEIKSDKFGYLKVRCGKLSTDKSDLLANINAIFEKVKTVKPASVKGIYIKSVALSTTGGFSCYLDFRS